MKKIKTEQFVYITIPCQNCIVAPVCDEKEELKTSIEICDIYSFMLALKKWDEKDKMWRKGLIEAWVNMGINITKNIRIKSHLEYPNHMRGEFISEILQIIKILTHIINSESWNIGNKIEEDKTKVKQLLHSLIDNL